jgi:uncharacterized protein
MDQSPPRNEKFFQFACLFEASLILVALLLGWLAGINPFQTLHFSETAIAYGSIGALPLFMMFLGLEQLQHPSVAQIKQLLLRTLGPGLNRYHWTDLLVLATIAGFSEELLFRGVLQPWLEISFGKTAGIIGSNLIFGLVHAVTPLYLVLAGLVGCYLGLALDFGGERNLLTPIIIHALYDFLAFIALMRVYRESTTRR